MKMKRLVCGYSGTGKDCLWKSFNRLSKFEWQPYHKNPNTYFFMGPISLLKFSTELRTEVDSMFNIWFNDYESNKDVVMFENGKTYRDILKEIAKLRREQDPDYWVKKSLNWEEEIHNSFMVTDWRYVNEYEYLIKTNQSVETIRVFRKDATIPPSNEESEHSLDDFLTDFLLIPKHNKEKEFEVACHVFPQYSDFKECKIASWD